MAALNSPTSTREQLRVSGLRATPQRILVLRVLEDSDEHIDAETLWLRAREVDPDISLATVYRTLAKLQEADLVTQRFYDRDHKREVYTAVNQEERFFFTCRNCKKVIQLRTPLIAQARRQWEQELGLVFSQGCMCFDGYCAACAQTVEAQRRPVPYVNGLAAETDSITDSRHHRNDG